MLTDPALRSQVDQLWEKFWSGGLSNPLDAIEQFSYLLFLKRLDDSENRRQRQAERQGKAYEPKYEKEFRWSYWSQLPADAALKHLKENVFAKLRDMGGEGSSFQRYMQNAECKISRGSLLIEACRLIDAMKIAEQQQDVQGDLYEYMLDKLSQSGRLGQFRTPRHIIRMMVRMIAPRPKDRIGDLAAGTGGFLVNAHQYILETHTSKEILRIDEQGWAHNLIGEQLTADERAAMKRPEALRGFDNDAGLTMLRIGSMNLILHGIESPQFFLMDSLSKDFTHDRDYDVILMNPPFKGAVDKDTLHESLKGAGTTKSELLFLHLILRALDMGGRCAVIAPDGVLFGSSRAHVETRRKIVEENRLDGVISMPSGVFKPYAGVSTAVLLFTRGAKTDNIWFYDMSADGYSLDDKRQAVAENDIPDLLACWEQRGEAGFGEARQARLAALKEQMAPLNSERLRLEGEVNRLTFEQAISSDGDGPIDQALGAARQELETLKAELKPLREKFNQLSRQFWVSKEQVKANKYDLSASRYRQVENEEVYYEMPNIILSRMMNLEKIIIDEIRTIEGQ